MLFPAPVSAAIINVDWHNTVIIPTGHHEGKYIIDRKDI
jgi:hypothetical protein